MNASRTTPTARKVKAIARRRPSYGKARTRTFVRGVIELSWCFGLWAATAYVLALPEHERDQVLAPALGGGLRSVAAGLLLMSAPVCGCLGAYRVVAALLDLCWPRRVVHGVVLDRGIEEGGPWTPAVMGPLVGWRRPTTLRWVVVADQRSGRPRTLQMTNRDRWFAAAPGAQVRVVTTGVLRHVRAVEVVAPAPPLVPVAPFAERSSH